MFRRLVAVLLAVALTSAAALGCGGDSGGAGSQGTGAGPAGSEEGRSAGGSDEGGSAGGPGEEAQTAGITKARFVEQANGICERGKVAIVLESKALQERDKGYDPARPGLEGARRILFPSLEDQIAKIRELGYPPGDRREIEAFLAALRQSIERIEKRKPETSEQLAEAMRPAGTLARRYGITECGYGY